MTQVSKRKPITPKQALARGGPIDNLLDPELFKSLADPTRAKLLACMIKCSRGCTVTEVAECCHVDFSVVSRHLQQLQRSGLLEATKLGRSVTYTVRYAHLCTTLRALANAIENCCPSDQAESCAGGCCGNC